MEKEVSEVDRKLLLKKSYLERTKRYIAGNSITQDELYSFVRKFFLEYLKLDYEFTYEELSQELNKIFIKPKVKERIDDFLLRLSESEYLEESILDAAAINSFLNEFLSIVDDIVYDEKSPKAPIMDSGIVKKIFKFKHRNPVNDAGVEAIRSMVDNVQAHIRNADLDMAKSSYVELMGSYDKLEHADKESVKDEVSKIYSKLQDMMRSSSNVPSSTAIPSSDAASSVDIADADDVIKSMDQISSLIDSGLIEDAKIIYAQTLRSYESLDDINKQSLYSRINGLYLKIQDPMPKRSSAFAKSSTAMKSSSAAKQSSAVSSLPNAQVSKTSKDNSDKDFTNKDISIKAIKDTPFKESKDSSKNPAPMKDSAPMIDSSDEPFSNIYDFRKGDADEKNSNYGKDEKDSMSEDILPDNSRTGQKIDHTDADDENMLFRPGVVLELKNSPTVQKTQQKIERRDDKDNKDAVGNVKDHVKNPKDEQKPHLSKMQKSSSETSLAGNISDIPFADAPNSVNPEKNVMFASPLEHIPDFDHAKTMATSLPFEKLLRRADDLISSDNLDSAQDVYSSAIKIYKSMDSADKSRHYPSLDEIFRKLDEALHKRSLHELLDTHSGIAPDKASAGKNASGKKGASKDKSVISSKPADDPDSSSGSLPLVVVNDAEASRVYELIEESYFNMDNGHSDLAMLKYYKALELYHKLQMSDKKKLYSSLYALFKTLSIKKK